MSAATEDSLRLQEEWDRLEQEIRLLKEQLDRRVRALYGRRSERRQTDETAVPGEDPAAAEKKAPRKKRRGHGPTKQPGLPVVIVASDLVGDARICEHCGGTLETLGHEAEEAELIAIEERRIVLERHLREKCRCGTCHIEVKTAPGQAGLRRVRTLVTPSGSRDCVKAVWEITPRQSAPSELQSGSWSASPSIGLGEDR